MGVSQATLPILCFYLIPKSAPAICPIFHATFQRLGLIVERGTMFFAIASPPVDWVTRGGERDNWKDYLATAEGGIIQSDELVKEAARQFSLASEHLPAVVVFRDINDTETIQVRLGELKESELENYFDNLFALFNCQAAGIRRYLLCRRCGCSASGQASAKPRAST